MLSKSKSWRAESNLRASLDGKIVGDEQSRLQGELTVTLPKCFPKWEGSGRCEAKETKEIRVHGLHGANSGKYRRRNAGGKVVVDRGVGVDARDALAVQVHVLGGDGAGAVGLGQRIAARAVHVSGESNLVVRSWYWLCRLDAALETRIG